MATRVSPRAGVLAAVVGAAALLLAGVAAALVGPDPTPSLDQRVQQVAGGLRCPSCDGESAAQSNAPMARSMRSEIRAQLRAGRTPEQVRSWFRDRYGDDIVLSPGSGVLGWLLWGGPPLVLAAGVVLLARRRPPPGPVPGAGTPRRLGGRALVGATAALLVVGVAVPVAASLGDGGTDEETGAAPAAAAGSGASARVRTDPATVAQQLDDAGRYEDAVAAWRRAWREHPGSVVVRTRLAFDLLRTGHPEDVPTLVRRPAHRGGAQRPLALLVLGLAQRDLDRPVATATLRSFLQVAPDHPAADQVRRLIAEG